MDKKDKNKFYVICDNIRSLENIGSVFRTADALGASKIFLCGICGRPALDSSGPVLDASDASGPVLDSSGPALDSSGPVLDSSGPALDSSGPVLDSSDASGPPHNKISKTALGAEKNVAWEYHSQAWRLVDDLKKQGVFIVALEQTKNSIDYRKFKPRFPMALIIGNEVKGILPSVLKRADQIIHLPMLGKKESLNVAVAFGVAGYWVRQK